MRQPIVTGVILIVLVIVRDVTIRHVRIPQAYRVHGLAVVDIWNTAVDLIAIVIAILTAIAMVMIVPAATRELALLVKHVTTTVVTDGSGIQMGTASAGVLLNQAARNAVRVSIRLTAMVKIQFAIMMQYQKVPVRL